MDKKIEDKKKEELSGCTFAPKINPPKKQKKVSPPEDEDHALLADHIEEVQPQPAAIL